MRARNCKNPARAISRKKPRNNTKIRKPLKITKIQRTKRENRNHQLMKTTDSPPLEAKRNPETPSQFLKNQKSQEFTRESGDLCKKLNFIPARAVQSH